MPRLSAKMPLYEQKMFLLERQLRDVKDLLKKIKQIPITGRGGP
jgi:hypothetical protein